jgi:hypothetical protein
MTNELFKVRRTPVALALVQAQNRRRLPAGLVSFTAPPRLRAARPLHAARLAAELAAWQANGGAAWRQATAE